jgi:P4 family phage/plasmid primase-like protien
MSETTPTDTLRSSPNYRPQPEFNADGIPDYIRQQKRWTVFYCPPWQVGQPKPKKSIRLPNGATMPTGHKITENGGNFKDVVEVCRINKHFYPAYYFDKENTDKIIFADFDADEKGFSPAIPQIPSFCERSVYGGYHVLGWYKGEKPTIPETEEVYRGGRWCVMTGDIVDNRRDINDLTDFLKQYITREKENPDNGQFKVPDAPTKTGNREPTLNKYVWSECARNIPFDAIMAGALALNRTFTPPHPDDYVKNRVVNSWRAFQAKAEIKKTATKEYDPEPKITEIKVAERFVRSLGGDFIYNLTNKQWHFWDGICWKVDERNSIANKARNFVKTLFKETEDVPAEDIPRYIKDLTKLNTKTGINNLVNLAAIQLTMTADDFDRDIHLLNLQNGTLVFEETAIHFKNHDKTDMCSLVGNCIYDPNAPVPELWQKHIETITGGDSALASNLQEILGYVLDGGNPNEHFLLLHGGGRNGKSVTLRTIMHILGNYGLYVNPLTLMENGNNSYSPERLLMTGKRLIVAQEPNKHDEDSHKKDTTSLDSAFLKAASGKDVIPARKIMSNDIKLIKVTGVITFCTNPLPKVKDESVAFWERIITIPFKFVIPGWQRDSGIEDKFNAVSSGILNWLLQGYERGRGKRFKLCPTIKNDIAEYRLTVDEYAGFCHTRIEDTFDSEVSPKDLYAAYIAYQKSVGASAQNETTFCTAMSKKYNKKHTMNGNVYTQIKICNEQSTVV